MKKQEKIDVIQKGINETAICRCRFTYDSYYCFYYPHALNYKFILGQEEHDFILNGYCIRKISQLKKVEVKDDTYNEINKMFVIASQVVNPNIDISSWQSIFSSLMRLNIYVEIEDALNEQYSIGIIKKVLKDKLYFKQFDADGIWDENDLEIRYSQITSVKWGTRYAEYWKRYLEREQESCT